LTSAAQLWPSDTFVDFDNGLNKYINQLRDTLGDSAESTGAQRRRLRQDIANLQREWPSLPLLP
jgi:hypothetical protein